MKLIVERAGALTTVQDLGRWGHQALGMPVSGAMDAPALTRGNLLLGNPPGAAALEVTVMGPLIRFAGEGCVAVAGGDLSPQLNGAPLPMWTAVAVKDGDRLGFGAPHGRGCRAYVCVGGGIDVPPVMGSRSTYMKAKIGGLEGRKLKDGDELSAGAPWSLWRNIVGTACPAELLPDYGDAPLRAVPGPQDSYVTPAGLKTFFETEYAVSTSADRMGCRLESDRAIEHAKGPDIVSDGIPMGAVQAPGSGLPIVMMADRQTTGGYVKIAVVHALDAARLAQKMPGETVRFAPLSQDEGVELSRAEAAKVERLRLFVQHAAAQPQTAPSMQPARSGAMKLNVEGKDYAVTWERLD
ncbi:biotin-dependent carboxyltransferase family protein [Pyramidobacter sp.]|uniref:5-oxoprolinase subunit C family protein n=1 Tax=Pyramidobacter sp. TaxID=1943581 RepID=UPI00333245AB